MNTSRAIGVDIGGSTVRAGIVGSDGAVLALAALPTPPGGEPAALAEIVARLVADACAHVVPTEPTIGIGIPGVREARTDVMLRAVNLPKLEGVDLRDLFGRRLNRAVRFDTDVNAAGIAQWRGTAINGAAPSAARFVYLGVGTGVGACVILDGHIVRHTRGGPGHLGHLIVDTNRTAPLCRCGVRGCLEAVVRSFTAENRPDAPFDLAALVHGLTIGLVQISHLYAPDEICLGGGVIDHHPHIPELCAADLGRNSSTLASPTLRITRAAIPSDRAGVIGAAWLATLA
ncbi:MAG: ROK family protein [Planctomycetes bacterium]|nr:ROK family protein [Planctomycetota bacterium]